MVKMKQANSHWQRAHSSLGFWSMLGAALGAIIGALGAFTGYIRLESGAATSGFLVVLLTVLVAWNGWMLGFLVGLVIVVVRWRGWQSDASKDERGSPS